MSSSVLKVALFLILSNVALADRFCALRRRSGCSAPFPPGHRNMGSSWWAIGSKDFGTYMTSLKTTLVVPESVNNNNTQGVMAINTAVENSDRNDGTSASAQTFQTLTSIYPDGWVGCGQKAGEWCTFASLYSKNRSPNQLTQSAFPHGAGSVDLSWTYEGASTNIVQQATDAANPNVKPLTALAQEPPWQFWPKTECQCSGSGIIPPHSYKNTVIKLAKAVPDFKSSVTTAFSSNSEPTTNDGGLTWNIDSIDIDVSHCNNPGACPDPIFDAQGTTIDPQDSDPNPIDQSTIVQEDANGGVSIPVVNTHAIPPLNDTAFSVTFIPPQEGTSTTADIIIRDFNGRKQDQSIPCNSAWTPVTSFITPFVTSVRARSEFCDNGDVSALRFKYASYDIWVGPTMNAGADSACGTTDDGKGSVGCTLLLKQ